MGNLYVQNGDHNFPYFCSSGSGIVQGGILFW